MWIGRKSVDKMRLPRKEAEKKKRVVDGPRDLQPRSFKHIVVTEQSWGGGEGTEAFQSKPWKPVAIQICLLSDHPRDKARTVTSLTETSPTTNRKLSPSLNCWCPWGRSLPTARTLRTNWTTMGLWVCRTDFALYLECQKCRFTHEAMKFLSNCA